jgi:regulator of protease activity HflC (stomatin/prohibitin superfamily)
MNQMSKRAFWTAVIAALLCGVFFAGTAAVGMVNSIFAAFVLGWHIFGTMLVWLVVVVHFYLKSLAEQERLDMAYLRQERASGTIFQHDQEAAAVSEVARLRLAGFEKWFLPIFSGIIALYYIGAGFWLWGLMDSLFAESEGQNLLLTASLIVAAAFVSFLFSRYATGLSSVKGWEPMRAGASSMLAWAVMAFLLAVALVLGQYNRAVMLDAASWVVIGVMLVVGFETAINIVMDFYRPRIAGKYNRPAMDSRLLGMVNQPGRILHTFASTIDYQFGFKVSQTWFYKLLAKAILPLVVLAVLVLYSLSCFVVIEPGEQAIIEHFGLPRDNGQVYGPGFYGKLPWPFGIAYKYPARKVQTVNVGFVRGDEGEKPLLWGEEHYDEEYNLLVATDVDVEKGQKQTGAPVSLVRANVPVQYVVRDLYDYLYNHEDSKKILEMICYRELTRMAINSKIETDDEEVGGHESLLTAGREGAAERLRERVQAAADSEGLGVEIVFLGLQGVHPPPEVVPEYHGTISAIQQKQQSVLDALADRNRDLTELAGSVRQADMLYRAAIDYQQALSGNDRDLIEELGAALADQIEQVKGEVYKIITESQVYAFGKAKVAEAEGLRFKEQLKPYQLTPELYKKHLRLSVLERALENVRKYVVVSDEEDDEVYIIDLQEQLSPDLYDIDLEEFQQ